MKNEIPKPMKKGDKLSHFTEKNMKEQYTSLPNDVTLGTDGTLSHKPTKTKKMDETLVGP